MPSAHPTVDLFLAAATVAKQAYPHADEDDLYTRIAAGIRDGVVRLDRRGRVVFEQGIEVSLPRLAPAPRISAAMSDEDRLLTAHAYERRGAEHPSEAPTAPKPWSNVAPDVEAKILAAIAAEKSARK